MGADVQVVNPRIEGGEQVADLVARSSDMHASEFSGDLIPRLVDEVPILALAACFAEGTTFIRDAADLRVKESDRIKAICINMKLIGVNIIELKDGFLIEGPAILKGNKIKIKGIPKTLMDSMQRLATPTGVAILIFLPSLWFAGQPQPIVTN